MQDWWRFGTPKCEGLQAAPVRQTPGTAVIGAVVKALDFCQSPGWGQLNKTGLRGMPPGCAVWGRKEALIALPSLHLNLPNFF